MMNQGFEQIQEKKEEGIPSCNLGHRMIAFVIDILCVFIFSSVLTSFAAPATATEATADEAASAVTARKPITRWYYKTINGKLYRRLYDATNEKWLTDWIPC